MMYDFPSESVILWLGRTRNVNVNTGYKVHPGYKVNQSR